MIRERTLQAVLVLLGLACLAGGYILVNSLLGRWSMPPGDQMILAIFLPIGVFLLLAVRNPTAHRTLILAVAWANLSHAAVMAIQGMQHPADAPSGPLGLAVMASISVALLALAPGRRLDRIAPVPAEPAPEALSARAGAE